MAKAKVHQMEPKSEFERRAEEAAKARPKYPGRIVLLEVYPHDAHTLNLNMIYLEPSDDPNGGEGKQGEFFIPRIDAELLSEGLDRILTARDTAEAWDRTAAVAAGGNVDVDEDGNIVPSTDRAALRLLNPPKAELAEGDRAIKALVAHMRRMHAAETSRSVPDGDGTWEISIKWMPGAKKPN